METKEYTITLRGCDGDTTINYSLTEKEVGLLQKIESKVNEIGGGCNPTLKVELLVKIL